MRRIALVLTVLLLAGCTSKPTTPAPAPSASSLPAGVVSLDCGDAMDNSPTLPEPYASAADVVGLDTASTLGVARSGGHDPHRLFAKSPLVVHAGHESTLSVPGSASITWGNGPADWATTLHVPACPGTGWLVFPGGYSVDKPACVPVRIRSGTVDVTVPVSVGARCQGYRGAPAQGRVA